ncbi:MAG TPA: hypothetical protein VN420_01910 [Candidatus Fimivivens sp.]|nr:hypothetical protein [Candidatus Fimivivens sp.]
MHTYSTLRHILVGFFLVFLAACTEMTNPQDVATEFQNKLKEAPIGSYVITNYGTCLRIESRSSDRDSLYVFTGRGSMSKLGITALSYESKKLLLPGEEGYAAQDRSFRDITQESRILNAPKGTLLLRKNISNGRTEVGMIMASTGCPGVVNVCWKNGSQAESEQVFTLTKTITSIITPSEQDYKTYMLLFNNGKVFHPEGFRKG